MPPGSLTNKIFTVPSSFCSLTRRFLVGNQQAIRIRLFCISEFPILPLNATASVEAAPLPLQKKPHNLFCITCRSTVQANCLCTADILIIMVFVSHESFTLKSKVLWFCDVKRAETVFYIYHDTFCAGSKHD